MVVLKGGNSPGKLRIATVYNLEVGKTYLLANSGGSAYGTNFLAIAERSVVKLPQAFRVDDLKGQKLTEQVEVAFTAAGLRDSDLLSKSWGSPVPVVMQTPPDAVPMRDQMNQKHKERIAWAVQKLQQSKGEQEMRESLGQVEEAVSATWVSRRLSEATAPATPLAPPISPFSFSTATFDVVAVVRSGRDSSAACVEVPHGSKTNAVRLSTAAAMDGTRSRKRSRTSMVSLLSKKPSPRWLHTHWIRMACYP